MSIYQKVNQTKIVKTLFCIHFPEGCLSLTLCFLYELTLPTFHIECVSDSDGGGRVVRPRPVEGRQRDGDQSEVCTETRGRCTGRRGLMTGAR